MKAELLKGHLDLLLLRIIKEQPAHGYAIIEDLKRRSRGDLDLPEGSVYPALHRMERAGLLKSAWSDEGGRRRRVYEISAKGSKALAAKHAEWGAFVRSIRLVLQGT
ncbi:MAG: helix-turn-helix transcriptional regulator [Dehalococcoidia bacterium]